MSEVQQAYQTSIYMSEELQILTIAYIEEKLKSSSGRRNFLYLINDLCKESKKSPERLTENDLSHYFSDLFAVKNNRKNTVRVKYHMLLSYFRYLDGRKDPYHIKKEFEPLLRNVRLEDADVKIRESDVIQQKEIEALCKYLETERMWMLRLAVELSVRYGLSSSRIVRLRRDDLCQSKDGYYIRSGKRADGKKTEILLREDTVTLLVRASSGCSDWVFCTSSGEQISLRRLEQQLSDAGQAVCGRYVTFMKLRNSCIAYLLASGASYDEIEHMTGSPASMLFRYREQSGKFADAAVRYED